MVEALPDKPERLQLMLTHAAKRDLEFLSNQTGSSRKELNTYAIKFFIWAYKEKLKGNEIVSKDSFGNEYGVVMPGLPEVEEV